MKTLAWTKPWKITMGMAKDDSCRCALPRGGRHFTHAKARSAQEHRETKRRTTSLGPSMIAPLVALILGCSDGREIVRRQLAQELGSGTSTVASTGSGSTASGNLSTGSGGNRGGTGETTRARRYRWHTRGSGAR